MKIKSLWIENEVTKNELGDAHNPYDTNSDVIIRLDDHSRWVGTFFTYHNIDTLARKNHRTGECLSGGYFWGSDMILIDMVTRERITQVINDIIEDGSFEMAFSRCPYDPDQDD